MKDSNLSLYEKIVTLFLWYTEFVLANYCLGKVFIVRLNIRYNTRSLFRSGLETFQMKRQNVASLIMQQHIFFLAGTLIHTIL